ncbi:MAG: type III-B CRISPR module-associated protein Cmr5 [Bacteroidota bacterium]
MSKRKIEAFIAPALDLIPDHLEKDGAVERVYKSYISAMGASMIQSGLLPTLAIFSAPQSDSSAGDKRKLIRLLTELLKKWEKSNIEKAIEALGANPEQEKEKKVRDRINFYSQIGEFTSDTAEDNRLLYFAADYKGHPQSLRRIRRDLTDASVAVKLCLRTFKLQGNESS